MATNLTELVSSLHTVRQQKAALEKSEKTILAEIKPLVDPQFDKLLEEDEETALPLTIAQFQLSRIMGTSRTLSADLLLERGVAPDIIQFATKTTTYFQYRIKETNK